jgi:hypothetical protein
MTNKQVMLIAGAFVTIRCYVSIIGSGSGIVKTVENKNKLLTFIVQQIDGSFVATPFQHLPECAEIVPQGVDQFLHTIAHIYVCC